MGLLDGVLGDALGSATGNAAGGAGAANLQGMLGGLLGQLSGSQNLGNNALLSTVMSLVQQHGGVGGIVEKFRSGGLSDVVASWVGTGANMPVSASQVQQVLGHSTINNVASSMGVDATQASSSIASMLPELINQLTPNGAVDAGSSDLLSKGIELLRHAQ
jgi:uncharacterized protein YidB (DUF937 family)